MFVLLLTPSTLFGKTNENCLKRVVFAEARGEPEVGQRAVAHVVINRSRQQRKPICSVVKQPGQFKLKAPPKGWTMVQIGRDPTGGATHFQKRDLKRWLGLRKLIKIGDHTFYGR